MADDDKSLTELFEEVDPLLSDLIYLVIDSGGVPKPRKTTLENALKSVRRGGLYGDLVNKTILGGAIALTNDQHFIALTGQDDWEDSLTSIIKIGGGYLDAGHEVILTGKVGLSYNISILGTGGFKIQRTFTINNEYDTISLIHLRNDIWQERGRSSNG